LVSIFGFDQGTNPIHSPQKKRGKIGQINRSRWTDDQSTTRRNENCFYIWNSKVKEWFLTAASLNQKGLLQHKQ